MRLSHPISSTHFVGICLWLLISGLVPDAFADDPFGLKNRNGRVRIPFRGNRAIQNYPLSNLPGNLEFDQTKVSLVADFEKAELNRVPVYLINPTDQVFRMESVALEIPIVLEAYLGHGHWERAESHNAYGFLSTRKEEHLTTKNFRVKKSRHWEEGEKATLRYALYQDGRAGLVSEPFEGRLPIGEIDKARHDMMSAALVPEPLRIRYHPEQTTRKEVAEEWYYKLSLLRFFGPCYADLVEAQKWGAFVHENPAASREDRDVAVRLQLELLKKWPAHYDIDRLHERCRTILNDQDPETEGFRPLCWKILRDRSEEKSERRDAELAKVAWNTIQGSSTVSEREAATNFLCVTHIARNYSPILEYTNHEKLLDHENPYIRIVTANFLLSKKNREASAVLEHYDKNQSSVGAYELVQILIFDQLYNSYQKPNWGLWGKALDKDPDYTISQLSLMFESSDSKFPSNLRKFSQSDLPPAIRQRLVKYCKQAPNGPKKQAIRRFLDDVNTNQNRIFGRALPQF